MQASVVELRYNMKDVLKALDRNETVDVLYHGKIKATIVPASSAVIVSGRMDEHPMFGMSLEQTPVDEVMTNLRGGRFNAI